MSTLDQPNNLKKLRKKQNKTQKELSKILDIPYRTIQRWESGENQIKKEKVLLLADYFNVSIPQLLGYEPIEDGVEEKITFNSGTEFENYKKSLANNSKYHTTKELSLKYGPEGKINDFDEKILTKKEKINDHISELIKKLNDDNIIKWLEYGDLLQKVQENE